jgi:hypothetical protein
MWLLATGYCPVVFFLIIPDFLTFSDAIPRQFGQNSRFVAGFSLRSPG